MAIHHRKVLISSQINYTVLVIPDCGDNKYCYYPYPDHLPPPPPPPQNFNGDESKTTLLTPIVVTLLFCLAIIFVTGCYTIRNYCFKNSRGRNSLNFDRNEDFVNENHGREMAHPIWLINTVGLQQSVIDSIAVFKYKKDEGLIDGADCSVCLSEFQEDESLRLLPKCSHAFHIPCIDTWLRSHKNCPLCRAPVALDTNNGALNTAERNLNGLSSREENLVDNFAYNGGLGTQENRDETSEMGRGAENIGPLALPIQQGNTREILDKNSHYFNVRNCDVGVRSDLADHSAIRVEELQEVRRSISMDSSSASVIHFAVSNIRPMEHNVCSKKLVSQKVGKQGNKSSSRIYGVMKSSSFGRHSHKGPGSSMKRSFSSSGKCYKPRSSTSQDSILPL